MLVLTSGLKLHNWVWKVALQQDVALRDITRALHLLLDDMFRSQCIVRCGPTGWPSILPDLAPLDSFLCKHVNDEVHWTYLKLFIQHITKANQNFRQETHRTIWIGWENGIHVVCRELGGNIDTQ